MIVVIVSAESAEEVAQLFGNYHQLSEILKEKANTVGKGLFSSCSSLNFFFRLLFQLLKLKAHCKDQISLMVSSQLCQV